MVCRQLGYSVEGATEFNPDVVISVILLDDVNCLGNEKMLFDCTSNAISDHNCNSYENVGVRCVGKYYNGLCYCCNYYTYMHSM